MKTKLLLFTLLLFVIRGFVMGQNVSTEIEKKSALIENFTGIHCGFCPQGHAIIHNLMAAQPEKVYTIAIHAGNYADPNPDEPNFIVEDGVTIHDEMGIDAYGYPSGTVNRRAFSADMITGRGSWTKDTKAVLSEDAPVNLWLQSNYDGDTRELTIDVELYYTANVDQENNYLSVAYVESNILGPQSGANAGNNYVHKHMLRGYITDVWGEVIENPQKGKFVEKSYTFTVPEFINDVPVTPSGIEIIAFVTAGETEVLNVVGGKPAYVNYEVSSGAVLSHPEFPVSSENNITRAYAFNYFDVQLENKGSVEITGVGFEVIINGSAQNVSWRGSIPPFECRPVTIFVDEYPLEASNTYSIQLTSINGQTVQGNTITGRFNGTTSCTTKLFVEIQTDDYADENRFLIKDRDGEIVKEFGPYATGTSSTYKEEVELEEGEIYCFEILDAWGDGIYDPARGSIKMYNSDNTLFYMMYGISDWGLRVPLAPSDKVSIVPADKPEATRWYLDPVSRLLILEMNNKVGSINTRMYAIDGRCLYNKTSVVGNAFMTVSIPTGEVPAGIYLIKITDNVKTETIKLFIN